MPSSLVDHLYLLPDDNLLTEDETTISDGKSDYYVHIQAPFSISPILSFKQIQKTSTATVTFPGQCTSLYIKKKKLKRPKHLQDFR